MIIAGDKCEKCKYGTLDETNRAKIMVYCALKERQYIYGECIRCEDFLKDDGTEEL